MQVKNKGLVAIRMALPLMDSMILSNLNDLIWTQFLYLESGDGSNNTQLTGLFEDRVGSCVYKLLQIVFDTRWAVNECWLLKFANSNRLTPFQALHLISVLCLLLHCPELLKQCEMMIDNSANSILFTVEQRHCVSLTEHSYKTQTECMKQHWENENSFARENKNSEMAVNMTLFPPVSPHLSPPKLSVETWALVPTGTPKGESKNKKGSLNMQRQQFFFFPLLCTLAPNPPNGLTMATATMELAGT